MEELELLKQYVESLGLHEKKTLTMGDCSALRTALRDAYELGLADYIERLGGPEELAEFISGTLYG
jgi:hypothetical protein